MNNNVIYVFNNSSRCVFNDSLYTNHLINTFKNIGFTGLVSYIGSNCDTIILDLNTLSITFNKILANDRVIIREKYEYFMYVGLDPLNMFHAAAFNRLIKDVSNIVIKRKLEKLING